MSHVLSQHAFFINISNKVHTVFILQKLGKHGFYISPPLKFYTFLGVNYCLIHSKTLVFTKIQNFKEAKDIPSSFLHPIPKWLPLDCNGTIAPSLSLWSCSQVFWFFAPGCILDEPVSILLVPLGSKTNQVHD